MSRKRPNVGREGGPYQLFMLVLCVWALAVLAVGRVAEWDESTLTILNYADNAVCALFFADFLATLFKAPNKWRYLVTWGWIDLLSSIPMVDALRWGRAARVMRIVRVLRGVRSARALTHFVVAKRAESAILASALITILLLVSASIAILEFEASQGGNITTAEDAMWWSISTMTTVGYGDRYPVTSEGRLVAIFLMAAGVGLFGTLSGAVASWFLSPAAKEADVDLQEVKHLLLEVRNRLKDQQADQR